MEFRVLGPLEVYSNGRSLPLGGRRQRLVLATLLLHANEVVSTDRLIDAVWGEAPPPTARKSLQVYISRLRGLLEGVHIDGMAPGYVLRLEPDQLDSTRLEHLARLGREALPSDPELAAARLDEALALWHGAPWGDLGDELEFRPDVERLGELYISIVEDRIEAELAIGRTAGLVGELEGLVSTHPLRGRLRGLLMLALYREGRQAEALRVYQDTRQYLAAELGIEPSSGLQRLEEQILLQDEVLQGPSPIAASRPVATIANPYKGLRPFSEKDAADFFGRDALVDELTRRLEEEQFLVVVGPSGSGKSSAVRAGLIPALRRGAVPGSDDWLIAGMLPGAHPFEAAEAALLRSTDQAPASLAEQMRGDDLDLLRSVLRVLPDADDELILVIDQFEELFLLVDSEDERSRFVRNLIEAMEDPHSPLRVVCTLRADFFDRPLDYPILGEMVDRGQVTVLPISPSGLEEAIVKPAAGVGVRVEPEVIAELVADVANEPGALPLFEFVLTEMFDKRESDILTLSDYRALGGLKGALSRRAEQICDQLDDESGETARQIFLRLITLGEGSEDTRRRVHRSELEGLARDASLDVTLDAFGAARLLTFDRDVATSEPTVELAHEALLREWPRLRAWIDDARNDLRLQRNLDSEARQWESADRHTDYLLTGSRLALYEDWSRSAPVSLTEAELEYLAASTRRRDEEVMAERKRRERERQLERRSVSRLRVLVGVLLGAVIAGTGLTVWALDSRSEAREQATLAQRTLDQLDIADQIFQIKSLTADSLATREIDSELSLLLALHAADLAVITEQPIPAEAVAAIHWALQAARIPYGVRDAEPKVLRGPAGLQGIFDLEVEDLLLHARDHVERGLTQDECAGHFEDGACPTRLTTIPPDIQSEETESVPLTAGRPLSGTRVTLHGAWTVVEADALRVELNTFTKATGIRVDYSGLEDLGPKLVDRLEEGNPPDLAFTPQPGFLFKLARRGELVDLGIYLDVDELRTAQSPHVIAMASVADDGSWPTYDGSVYGGLIRTSVKSLIWYPVPEFEQAGYEIPATWDELVALTDQMIADGRTPWCHGEDSGGANGWPGTDWIEDIALHEHGPEVYDAWVRHEIGFDDPRIRSAWERMNAILLEDGRVFPTREKAAVLPWYLSVDPLLSDPPGCWLYHQASFIPNMFSEGAESGEDAAAFPFPAIDPTYADAIVGGGDYLIAFSDRPEVRALVRYMLGPQFGREMAKVSAGSISPHSDFPLNAYRTCEIDATGVENCAPNEVARLQADTIRQALDSDTFRFDGSDMMHPYIGQGVFWEAMVEFVAHGPDNLDELLAMIERAWAEVEAEEGQ